MRTITLSSRLVLTGAVLATTAGVFGSVVSGCGTDSTGSDFSPDDHGATVPPAVVQAQPVAKVEDLAALLRQAFPEHADEVLEAGVGFAGHSQGFSRRWGGSVDADALQSPLKGAAGVLDAILPQKGHDAIRLVLGDGFEVHVRELDVAGEGRSAGSAIAYTRAGGTSYWTATSAGAEEWLHLGAEYVRSDAPLATWEIEGGTVRSMADGDRVAVFDEAGVARIWVTAPKALTKGGETLETSFEVKENRLSLYVDTDGEEVLVDPVWTTVAPMLTARSYPVVVGLPNGKALSIAGINGTWVGVAEVYDPVANIWTSAGTAYASAGHEAVLLPDGRVLVAAGYGGGSTCINTARTYDPATNSWTTVAPLAVGRCLSRMVLLQDGRALVTGGVDGNSVNQTTGEIYNPMTNTWTTTAPMATGRYDHGAVVLNDGRVLVASGSTSFSTVTTTAEIYNPATNTWTSAGTVLTSRHEHTLTLLPNGRALLVGGANSAGTPLSSVELYNPMTNSWATGPSMSSARSTHVALKLGSGSVLVAGGYTSSAMSAGTVSTELFNPTTNLWSTMPSMATARFFHGGAVIVGGKVLVAGGKTGSSTVTAAAELFSNGALGDGCTLATDCQSGFCADGVCCNSACGGTNDCQSCNAPGSVGTCVLAPAATVCRASVGACDTAEVCDGMNIACPMDTFAPAGTTCRMAAGTCDIAESCTGMSALCPADTFVGGGTVCRAAVDVCDAPEACTGVTAACPADAVLAAGTGCRPSAGMCDLAEACNGVSPLCPMNTFVAAGTSCRASAGPCDLPESCSGAAADCPMDSFVPMGTACRQSVGACDATETCSGMGAACPTDAFAPAGTMCRPIAGPCDAAEACDGASTVCPLDLLAPVGTSCRTAAGPCDAEEKCDGTTIACPADGLLPMGTVCRAAATDCDLPETCTGSLTTCPGDLFRADGVLCDDKDPCSLVDSCKGGQCAAGTPLDCTAKDECQNNGACDSATGQCVAPPPKADGTKCSGGTCQMGACTPETSSSSSSSGSGSSSSSGAGGSMGEGGSGGTPSGAGGGQTTSDGGCDCRITGDSESGNKPWALLGLALVAVRRMRRRGR